MDLEAGTSAKGVDLVVTSPMFRPELSITIVTEQRAQQEEQQSCHLSDAWPTFFLVSKQKHWQNLQVGKKSIVKVEAFCTGRSSFLLAATSFLRSQTEPVTGIYSNVAGDDNFLVEPVLFTKLSLKDGWWQCDLLKKKKSHSPFTRVDSAPFSFARLFHSWNFSKNDLWVRKLWWKVRCWTNGFFHVVLLYLYQDRRTFM